MPRVILQKLARFANTRGLALKGARVVVGGVAYKPDVRDARESPAQEVIKLLIEEGLADVSWVDPLITDESHHELPGAAKFVTVEQAVRMKPDIFILITPHSDVPWERIAQASRIVFDTRYALKKPAAHEDWIKL